MVEQILKVARKATGFKRAGLIINRVKAGGVDAEVEIEASNKGFDFIHVVPEDETISKFDVEGKSFLVLPECAALKSVRGIVERLDEQRLGKK